MEQQPLGHWLAVVRASHQTPFGQATCALHRLQHGAPVSAGTSVQGTKFTYIDRTMKVCMASFPHFRNFFVAPRAFLRVSSDFRSFDTRVSFASGRSALWRHTHVAGRYIHATFPRYILRARVARPHERENAKPQCRMRHTASR